MTDVGLKDVGTIKSLQLLNLRGTKTTDAGLKEIASLSSLQSLDLSLIPLTDAGMEHLRDPRRKAKSSSSPRKDWSGPRVSS